MRRQPRLVIDDNDIASTEYEKRGKNVDNLEDSEIQDSEDNRGTHHNRPSQQQKDSKLQDVGNYISSKRKNRGKNKRHKKLRRIMVAIFSVLFFACLGVFAWNSIQMLSVRELASTIDDSFTKQESGISNVKKLGNLLTIHDTKSFNWVMENIEMTPSLKRSLFIPNEDGSYTYKGTSTSDDIAPTYEVVEVQYEEGDDPLSYLAVFNVTLGNDTVRSYFVTCKFDGNILTAFHVY